jgi:hypothetical protein
MHLLITRAVIRLDFIACDMAVHSRAMCHASRLPSVTGRRTERRTCNKRKGAFTLRTLDKEAVEPLPRRAPPAYSRWRAKCQVHHGP